MAEQQFGDLTLTTPQIQERLNLVPEHSTAIADLQEAIKAFVNSEQVQTLIATALADYSTTTEMNTAISTAITQALTAYVTQTALDTALAKKVDKVTGKQLSTEDFTTALKTKLDALPTNAALTTQISTAISNALVSYYTKTEVDNLLSAKQTAAQVSAAIASALTSYSTTAQMNAAISTALVSYYTKTQVDESQQAQNAQITAIVKALGLNPTTTTVALTAEQTGKAVTFNSERVASKSGYAVSAPVTVSKGKVYIIPMTATPSSDVSLVSHFEHRTFDQEIAYVYEHGEINGEDVITKAYAVYDMSIYYTYSYDAQGNLVSIVDKNGAQVQELPQTRTVTESYYIPLMEQGWTPAVSGSFLFVAPKTMQIVVSNQTAAVSGNITVVDLGLTENMGHNWLSKFDDQAEIEALGSVYAQLKAIAQVLGSMGDFECNQVSCVEVPKVQGQPMVVTGSGAPAAPVVPTFVGQKYLDVTNKKEYTAFSVTNSVSDWVLVN